MNKNGMKRGIALVCLALLSSAAVFAGGSKEDDDGTYYRRNGWKNGEHRQGFGDPSFYYDEEGNKVELEEISAEGTLVLEEGTMPYLDTPEGRVFLMVPPRGVAELGLSGGETVAVSGYDMPRKPWGRESDSVFLRVTGAEIDGKQIVLMGGGRRGGGRGRHPGGCW